MTYKYLIFTIVLCLPIILLGQVRENLSVDFRLQHFIEHQADTTDFIGLFVKGNSSDAKDFVENNQGIYRGSIKGWQYIRIPGSSIKKLVTDTRFTSIDYAPYKGEVMSSDTMRVNNRINGVHNGINPLHQAYTGAGVIYGFIDTGIDFAHPDFRDTNDKTRILHIWDQTKPNNALLTPAAYGYGQHWDSTQINAGSCTNQDQWGHGSTVSGAGAGNGLANGRNKGVAPDADIIAVESKFNATDWLATVVDAIEYIYSYADVYDKPCVINASVGTYLGSHDGLDPYALYIDSLILAKRGRLFVASAGNSGNWQKYHLHTDVVPDTSFTWFANNPSSAFGGSAAFWEMWTDTAEFNQVQYAVGADKVGANYEFRGRTQFYNVANNLNTLLYDTIRNNNDEVIATVQFWAQQRDGQYLVQVYIPAPDSSNYFFRFESFGTGSFDVWSRSNYGMSAIIDTVPDVAVFPEITKYVHPDTLQSIVSSFQCSPNVITVANYANDSGYVGKYNDRWYPNNFERGKLFSSSSKGPNRLGAVKPEIAASGHTTLGPAPIFRINQWVANNTDSTMGKGGMHMSNGGTSMASPVVGGVGALLLEKCPSLSQLEFIDLITSNAYTDNFTGSNLPDFAFGYGKLDGLATLVGTNFEPTFSGDTLFCKNDSTTISLDSTYTSALWENGSNSLHQTFLNSDTTYVTSINIAGCKSDTLNLIIFEKEKPTINLITAPYTHCEGDSVLVEISGVDIVSVMWSDGNATNPRYYIGDSLYVGLGFDSDGCPSDSGTYEVQALPLPSPQILYYSYDSLIANSGFVDYQWFLDGSNYANTGMDSVVIASQNGIYTVEVIGTNGCSNTSAPFSYNSVNVEYMENNSLSIFPNPTEGIFVVEHQFEMTDIFILDAIGKVIKTHQNISNTSVFDISNQPNGFYFIKIFTEKGQFVHKIVLNK
jgi:hypothetical protein